VFETEKIRIGSLGFQKKFIQIVFEDCWLEIIPYLKEEYFDLAFLRTLTNFICQHYNKYKEIITKQSISENIKELCYDVIVQKEILDYFKNFEHLLSGEKKEIKSIAREFFRKQHLKNSLLSVADDYEEKDSETIEADIKSTLKTLPLTIDIDYLNVLTDTDKFINLPRSTIKTGLARLDDPKYLNGGLGKGELGMLIGGIGGGKSHFLVDRACSCLKQTLTENQIIVYFTMELFDTVIGTRVLSNLLQIPYTELKKNFVVYQDKIKDLQNQYKGRIFVKEFPSRTATVDMLEIYLESLINRNFEVAMILVDYPDEMKIGKGYQSEKPHQLLSDVYRDLRRLAHEEYYNCPLWLVSQSNRCLKTNTIVQTPNGDKEIIKVNKGDEILTNKGFKKITYKSPVQKQPVYKITLANGKTISCSEKHLFPTSSGELKSILEGLQKGDKLFCKKS